MTRRSAVPPRSIFDQPDRRVRMGGDMVKRLVAAGAAAVVVFMLAGCEPSMTITAKPSATLVKPCSQVQVTGNVSPITATPKVVLQVYGNGKWQDLSVPAKPYDDYTVRSANVSQRTGGYAINFMYVWYTATEQFRVRSNASSAASPTFKVSPNIGNYPGLGC